MKPKKYIYYLFLLIFVSSCYQDMNNSIADFKSHEIRIPYDSLDYKICSLYKSDAKKKYCIKYVTYVQRVGCTYCSIKEIAEMEKKNIDQECYNDVEFVYIFGTDMKMYDWLYSKLCNFRIEGSVYIDTCNAFLSANPHIPDNELFHTFVINNDGKVLMVGNPFQNEKMEALFQKIIANERKNQ